jgi:hypothetical protein
MSNAEPFLSGSRLIRFEALQRRLVPRADRFSADERTASRALVNALVGRMPAANRKKLGLFLFIIDLVSLAFGLRSFRKLSPDRQDRVLHFLFDAPVGLLRKGFWGLNTLSKLGVYGQTTLYEEIGYRVRENPPNTEAAS